MKHKINNSSMKRIILFSNPNPKILLQLIPLIFDSSLSEKIFAYMPADGGMIDDLQIKKYAEMWKNLAEQQHFQFKYINNLSNSPEKEAESIQTATVLMITGGTCRLLENLRKSKLIEAVKVHMKKNTFIYAGFSAGAMLLKPSMELATIEPFITEKNPMKITDLKCLNIVDFEIFPHYDPKYAEILAEYRTRTLRSVIPLTDGGYLVQNFN
jgi:peptidase E